MDDYFLWIPIVSGIIAFLCFSASGALLSHERAGGFVFLALLGAMFISLFSECLFENGKGQAIIPSSSNISHRMVIGQMYEVVYQSENGSQVLLRGVDGVRYYHFAKRVPQKFIVGKDYALVPVSAPSPSPQ